MLDSLGSRLKEARERRGLTLRALGERASLSHSFISDIESGRSMPSIETLQRLAEILNVTVTYLLDDEEQRAARSHELDVHSAFAERLRDLRQGRRLSQKKLANATGVSRAAISLYEIGRREPELATVRKLADFFNVSTDYLLGRSDIGNPEQTSPIRIALHRSDGYDKPLPPEAVKSIEEFVEFLRRKYAVKGEDKGDKD